MTTIHGRLGGRPRGYDLHVTWNGSTLDGRIGAAHPGDGKNVHLHVSAGQVKGRVGSAQTGFTVLGTLTADSLDVRLGPLVDFDYVHLYASGDALSGRYGGSNGTQGFTIRRTAPHVTGRIGSIQPDDGKDFALSAPDVPLPISALLAACAYKVLMVPVDSSGMTDSVMLDILDI